MLEELLKYKSIKVLKYKFEYQIKLVCTCRGRPEVSLFTASTRGLLITVCWKDNNLVFNYIYLLVYVKGKS